MYNFYRKRIKDGDILDKSKLFLDKYGTKILKISQKNLGIIEIKRAKNPDSIQKIVFGQFIEGVKVLNAQVVFIFDGEGRLMELQSHALNDQDAKAMLFSLSKSRAADSASKAILKRTRGTMPTVRVAVARRICRPPAATVFSTASPSTRKRQNW